jgi:hypothetical protein
MTLTVAIAANAVLAIALLAILLYVCLIPFRKAFDARADLSPASEAEPQAVPERYAA